MLWNSSFEYMAYTGRYESKSHELPVAFDDCSDKEAFIEDCKVVQLLLICFLPKMVGRFHWLGLSLDWIVVIFPSPLSMTKNKNQVDSIQRRPLKKAAKLTESFTGSKSSVSRWLKSSSIICSFFAIICNLMQSVDRNGDEVMCNQFDDRNNWKWSPGYNFQFTSPESCDCAAIARMGDNLSRIFVRPPTRTGTGWCPWRSSTRWWTWRPPPRSGSAFMLPFQREKKGLNVSRSIDQHYHHYARSKFELKQVFGILAKTKT